MSETQTPTPAPAVNPTVRTASYWAGAIAPILGTATLGVVAAVAPEAVPVTAAVVGAVVGAITTWAGVLGIVYRPTA